MRDGVAVPPQPEACGEDVGLSCARRGVHPLRVNQRSHLGERVPTALPQLGVLRERVADDEARLEEALEAGVHRLARTAAAATGAR